MKKFFILLITGILSMVCSGFAGWTVPVPFAPLQPQPSAVTSSSRPHHRSAGLNLRYFTDESSTPQSSRSSSLSSLDESWRTARLLATSA